MKIHEIIIVVDTNDGDDITSVNSITDDDLNIIKPLITAIKNFKPYEAQYESKYPGVDVQVNSWRHANNYPFGDCLRDDLGQKSPREYYDFDDTVIEMFEDLCPYNEYGFHTIVSVTISPVTEKTVLLQYRIK